MNHRFLLSCESTVDMPYAYVSSRQLPVLFYSYLVDNQTYPDDMGRDPQALPRFYDILRQGKLPMTSQLNEYQYEEFLEPLVREHDVLHICFGSGMTASAANAEKAAQVLREKTRSIGWWLSIPCAAPPAMACWWIWQQTCGIRGVRWTRPLSGCWKTGGKSTISFSLPTSNSSAAAVGCPAPPPCSARC